MNKLSRLAILSPIPLKLSFTFLQRGICVSWMLYVWEPEVSCSSRILNRTKNLHLLVGSGHFLTLSLVTHQPKAINKSQPGILCFNTAHSPQLINKVKESSDPLVCLTSMRYSFLASKTCKQSKIPIVFHKHEFKRVCCYMTMKKLITVYHKTFPYRGCAESHWDSSLTRLRQEKNLTSFCLNTVQEGRWLSLKESPGQSYCKGRARVLSERVSVWTYHAQLSCVAGQEQGAHL